MNAFASPAPDATPVWLVDSDNWDRVKTSIGAAATAFAERCGFKPKAGRIQLLPGDGGAFVGVLFGVDGESAPARDPFAAGKLATSLPDGVYRFANPPYDADLAALGFLLAQYRYGRFKADSGPKPRLVAPDGVDRERVERIAAAVAFGRDLVNAPANTLGPHALEQETVKLAEEFDASVRMVRGEDLLAANFPLIHAVGRAAAEEPRIVDFSWGREDAPKVALIGKGVTFDTGGLDIKPASGMELMKKDMGGAATALALARLVMEEGLDLRLRVVIPIVENAISAPAMRPGDVLISRKGLSVEVGNTDAEGRLILADALALADEDAPELMLDFATLTGAARVALGPDLPPFYTDDEALAGSILRHAARVRDPLWRMPLWRPYEAMIEGTVGDISNSGTGGGMAGSITAALFLRRFVDKAKAWAHFDVYAWNPKPRAQGPAGGELQAARALFELLTERFPRR
ncbi:MAG TPA: leucyl aminopeptidase family protein [Roseiarcus sp.]